MIDVTLGFILDALNGYLAARFPTDQPHVVLSGLAKQDGTVADGIDNRIVLTLANIERENIISSSARRLRPENDGFADSSSPLNLNLYLLISAAFDNNYPESFKLLSAVLGFFQGNTAFVPGSAPGFPRGLKKLNLELVNLDFQELNHLWSGLSGKYLPSVLYKVRMLTIDEGWLIEKVPAITGVDTKL